MPHLNNKQNKNTNQIISRQDYHLTQPCPSEEKQTNKNSTKISQTEGPGELQSMGWQRVGHNWATNTYYKKLTQTTGPILGGQKPKGRKNSTLKPWKRRPQTQ